jgi:hypothetical protein
MGNIDGRVDRRATCRCSASRWAHGLPRLRGQSRRACNYTNPAVATGRTADSVVVICQTGIGRFYYKGVGLKNGLSVEIDDPGQTAPAFAATNNGVQYSLSPAGLTHHQGFHRGE